MNEPSYMGRRQLEEYRRAVGMYDGSKVSQPWLDTKSPCVLLLLVFCCRCLRLLGYEISREN